jgi:hypothetical protein
VCAALALHTISDARLGVVGTTFMAVASSSAPLAATAAAVLTLLALLVQKKCTYCNYVCGCCKQQCASAAAVLTLLALLVQKNPRTATTFVAVASSSAPLAAAAVLSLLALLVLCWYKSTNTDPQGGLSHRQTRFLNPKP